MVFYFSGTGNSRYAANNIAGKQGGAVYDIAEMLQKEQRIFVPQEGEAVGFVFPVYAWGPPEPVLEFIRKSRLALSENYIFAVMTCGQDAGDCGMLLQTALKRAGIALHGQFSVVMPDNYIVGYQLDTPERQQKILKEAMRALEAANEKIASRYEGVQVEKGALPRLKSRLIHPLFLRFFNPLKHFRVTERCTSCGLCQRICPSGDIVINSQGRPIWAGKCYGCLGCINRCPATAIEYGKATIGRRRYYNPLCGGDRDA